MRSPMGLSSSRKNRISSVLGVCLAACGLTLALLAGLLYLLFRPAPRFDAHHSVSSVAAAGR